MRISPTQKWVKYSKKRTKSQKYFLVSRFSFLVLLALVVSVISINTTTALAAPVPGTYYTLKAVHSGKCLDVSGASTADNANVIQWTCGTGTNQQWQWAAIGSYFRLIARHSGKCADVSNNSTADGGDIIQWTCGTGNNQQWSRQ